MSDRWAPPLPDCPVVPLGQNDGEYFFLSPAGEFRRIKEARLGAYSAQLSLFNGDDTYLKARWPRWRDGELVGHNRDQACAGLIAMCAGAGLWDPDTQMRGHGVWRDPDGRVLNHTGTGGGEVRAAGLRIGRAVYPRKPRLTRPDLIQLQ